MLTSSTPSLTKTSFFENLHQIQMSPIVKIAEMARQLEPDYEKKHGSKFIHLERGEIDLNTPPVLITAINQNFSYGKTKYPKSGGELPLKEKIAEKLRIHNKIPDILPEDIVVTMGGQEALNLAFQLFANQTGGGFSPIWSVAIENFFPYSNITFEEVPLNKDFSIDYHLLENTFKKISFFYLNNPQNPSGKVFSKQEISEIIDLCIKYKVFLISDEAYEHIIFDGLTFTSAAAVAYEKGFENLITAYTYSKSFAATGLRTGYAVSKNKTVIRLLTAAQYTHTGGVPTAIQYGLLDAYTIDLSDFIKEFELRRNALYNGLLKIKSLKINKPEGAFYIYPDFSDALQQKGIQPHQMLDVLIENGVIVVPGSAFTKKGHFETYARLSFSAVNIDQINVAVERLGNLFG